MRAKTVLQSAPEVYKECLKVLTKKLGPTKNYAPSKGTQLVHNYYKRRTRI